MSDLAIPSLTNSQPATRRVRGRGWLATIRQWRRRIHERQLLASLGERELADFGATSADVYRELSTPFWRAMPPC
jgi:uncharacterized protein YjiS (DUF1127 family)